MFTEPRFKIVILLLLIHLLSFCTSNAQVITIIDAKDNLKEVATLPKQIKEASGLTLTNGVNLWTHNDGGIPVLFSLDTLGNLTKTLQLNHPNSGWEDLTQDKKGNVYIGGFGNNKNERQNLKIYKIPNPDTITSKVYNGEIIEYRYGDQKSFPPHPSEKNFDMDAFFAWGDSLFLFTKNRTIPFSGYTKVYMLPQDPGQFTVMPSDSLFLGAGPMLDKWVTSADISPDGRTVALLSHQCIWLIRNFKGKKLSTGHIYRINLNHFSHKAGVCFATNTRFYIVDELEMGIIGGKLYSFDFGTIIGNPQ